MSSVTTLSRVAGSPRESRRLGPDRERDPRSPKSHDELLVEWVATYDRPEDAPSLDWLARLVRSEPRIDERSLSAWSRFWKRTLDVVVAVTLLVLAAPLMLLVAVLIKCTSRGPVIYRQERVGLNLRRGDRRHRSPNGFVAEDRRRGDRRRDARFGQPIVVNKFRTMRVDAERDGAQFSSKGDTRITWLGNILRKTRIDELPQLWNVLVGEMSIVGPRPERPEFVGQLIEEIPDYPRRLGIKPGLTGVAQIVNGYDNDLPGFRRRVLLDQIYLQNECLRNDLVIMFRTIRVVATGDGAM